MHMYVCICIYVEMRVYSTQYIQFKAEEKKDKQRLGAGYFQKKKSEKGKEKYSNTIIFCCCFLFLKLLFINLKKKLF